MVAKSCSTCLQPASCAGKANGAHRVWLNGALVYDKNNALYRTVPGIGIEKFTFRNFHGGSTDLFRPDQTQYNWCVSNAMHAPPTLVQLNEKGSLTLVA
jgi:hypothetical protein